MLSGTAAIVGHESRIATIVEAQLDEMLANFDSLIGQRARARRPAAGARSAPARALKVYVRDRDEIDARAGGARARLPAQVPRIVLHAAICRRELRVEIDGVHGGLTQRGRPSCGMMSASCARATRYGDTFMGLISLLWGIVRDGLDDAWR